jgi:hypothetical protein
MRVGSIVLAVAIVAGTVSACDKISKSSGNGATPPEPETEIRYSYTPTLAADGLWITNTTTGSTTHCRIYGGDEVKCSPYASGAGEEPSFRYDPKTGAMEPLNQAARIDQMYKKYGLTPKPTDVSTSDKAVSAAHIVSELQVGDIRDCKQFRGGDPSQAGSWVDLPKDKTGVCVPPPSGYILNP